MRTRLRAGLGERGAAAVEFGLILPVLLTIVGGILDFGRMYNQQILLSNAARDGARQVVSNSSTGWTAAQIQTRIANAASPLSVTSSATSWYCTSAMSGTGVTVTVTPTVAFDYTILKFIPGLPKPVITGTATMTCG